MAVAAVAQVETAVCIMPLVGSTALRAALEVASQGRERTNTMNGGEYVSMKKVR